MRTAFLGGLRGRAEARPLAIHLRTGSGDNVHYGVGQKDVTARVTLGNSAVGLVDGVPGDGVATAGDVIQGNGGVGGIHQRVSLHEYAVRRAQTHRGLRRVDVIGGGLHARASALEGKSLVDQGDGVAGNGAALVRAKADALATEGVNTVALYRKS